MKIIGITAAISIIVGAVFCRILMWLADKYNMTKTAVAKNIITCNFSQFKKEQIEDS